MVAAPPSSLQSRPAPRPVRRLATRLAVVVSGAPPVVLAGLRQVLAPHADRVQLRDAPEQADVELADHASVLAPDEPTADSVPLVVLVRDGDVAAAHRARVLGASEVVPAGADGARIVEALEAAARAGRVPVGAPAGQRDEPGLSRREQEVLAGVCAGMSNNDIAAGLYLSINSVKSYIRTAYRKIGVSTRAQAVAWGIRHGYDVGDGR